MKKIINVNGKKYVLLENTVVIDGAVYVPEATQGTEPTQLQTAIPSEKSPKEKQKELTSQMKKMRRRGFTYKTIAKHLNDGDVPTFSGSGRWHAQTIHRLVS